MKYLSLILLAWCFVIFNQQAKAEINNDISNELNNVAQEKSSILSTPNSEWDKENQITRKMSNDCLSSRNKSSIEILICSSPQLFASSITLNINYQKLLAKNIGNQENVYIKEHEEWMRSRSKECNLVPMEEIDEQESTRLISCLSELYSRRTAELEEKLSRSYVPTQNKIHEPRKELCLDEICIGDSVDDVIRTGYDFKRKNKGIELNPQKGNSQAGHQLYQIEGIPEMNDQQYVKIITSYYSSDSENRALDIKGLKALATARNICKAITFYAIYYSKGSNHKTEIALLPIKNSRNNWEYRVVAIVRNFDELESRENSKYLPSYDYNGIDEKQYNNLIDKIKKQYPSILVHKEGGFPLKAGAGVLFLGSKLLLYYDGMVITREPFFVVEEAYVDNTDIEKQLMQQQVCQKPDINID